MLESLASQAYTFAGMYRPSWEETWDRNSEAIQSAAKMTKEYEDERDSAVYGPRKPLSFYECEYQMNVWQSWLKGHFDIRIYDPCDQ